MKPRSKSYVIAIALCLLALFVAQTFGSKVAYYCECGGKPVKTQSSHCHGPHGEKCHSAEAQVEDSHNEEDSSERENHQAVSQDVKLRPLDAPLKLIAPQVLVAILPMVEAIFARQETKVAASYCMDFGESPPSGITVARTIVLLI